LTFNQQPATRHRALGASLFVLWFALGFASRCLHFAPALSLFFLMHPFTAVVEKCPETGLFVGFVPGFPGAHTQGESLDELQVNLREVVSMLLEDGEPQLEAEFVGTQTVAV
jgi:predicted RNase H-like HicB family nuclease